MNDVFFINTFIGSEMQDGLVDRLSNVLPQNLKHIDSYIFHITTNLGLHKIVSRLHLIDYMTCSRLKGGGGSKNMPHSKNNQSADPSTVQEAYFESKKKGNTCFFLIAIYECCSGKT